jgi:hypothetical protein
LKIQKKSHLVLLCLFTLAAGLLLIDHSGIISNGNNSPETQNSLAEDQIFAKVSSPLLYVEELQARLVQHFESDYSDPTAHLAMLKNPETYDDLIRINYLLGLTMDLGVLLDSFEPYGLVSIQRGAYEIDHLSNPGWLTLDMLLSALFSPVYVENILAPVLMQDGFNLDELESLISYLNNTNPQLEIAQAALSILETSIIKLETTPFEQESKVFYSLLSVHINELAYYTSGHILKDWALGLMEQIDPTSQALLVSHLVKNLPTTKLFASSMDASVDTLVNEITEGQMRNEYRKLISELTQNTESLK